jgi:hypothetical protein
VGWKATHKVTGDAIECKGRGALRELLGDTIEEYDLEPTPVPESVIRAWGGNSCDFPTMPLRRSGLADTRLTRGR